MNSAALHNISYGLYVIVSRDGDRLNGQIANTVFQISSDPPTLAVSINKQNLTHELIMNSRRFAVSVLSEQAPLSLIGQFGFKSGRDIDKFGGVSYRPTPWGLPYLTEYTLAWIEVEGAQEVDAGTHTIFIGKVIDADVLKQGAPMTYAYYHRVKRGSTPLTAPTHIKAERKDSQMDKYVCTVCGYEYDPAVGDPENDIAPGTKFEDLPSDWVCPVCGVDKGQFEKIT